MFKQHKLSASLSIGWHSPHWRQFVLPIRLVVASVGWRSVLFGILLTSDSKSYGFNKQMSGILSSSSLWSLSDNWLRSTEEALDLAGTGCPGDVPWRYPKGPNVRDLQGTFRGHLEDRQKIDDLMKKVFFKCNSLCFKHLLLFLTGKTNIQKF